MPKHLDVIQDVILKDVETILILINTRRKMEVIDFVFDLILKERRGRFMFGLK
jgi:hypothetical protein